MSDFSPFISFGLAAIVVVGILFCGSAFEHDDYIDGPMATVVRDTRLCSGDTLSMPLRTGEKVRILAYEQDKETMMYTVTTESGMRGEIGVWDVDLPLLLNETEHKDTIRDVRGSFATDVARRPTIDSFSGIGSDGERINLLHSKIRPAIANAEDYRINLTTRACRFVSRERFEQTIFGRNHHYIDSVYPPAVYMLPDGDGFRARLRVGIFDSASGFFSYPEIEYGRDTLARAISYVPFSRPATAAIARHTPMLSEVTDLGLTSFLSRDGVYSGIPVMPTFGALYRIGVALAGILWLFLPLALPAMIIGMLECTPPARVLPNSVVSMITVVVALPAFAYWLLMLIVWDAPWWCLLVMLIAIFWAVFISLEITVGIGEPHSRCPDCHHMWSFDEYDRTHERSSDSEKVIIDPAKRKVGSVTLGFEKRWIETTDEYGHVEKTEPNYYRQFRDFYEQDIYRDTYRTHHYRTYLRCSFCGRLEEGTAQHTEQIGHDFAGICKSSETDLEYIDEDLERKL